MDFGNLVINNPWTTKMYTKLEDKLLLCGFDTDHF